MSITTRYAICGTSMALAAVVLAGCGGGSGGGPSGGPAASEQALNQFADCDALRAAIVEDARQKITVQAQRLRDGGFVPPASVPTGGASPIPAATASPAGSGPTHGGVPRDFTDTNTQVATVDEADVVETDGTHLYLLHGIELQILDAWPPETTALRSRVAIEGAPQGMFVAGGRALVVSAVFDASGAFGGGDACHVIGPPLPAFGGHIPILQISCGAPLTKVTLLDVSGAVPAVVREIYLEGSYVSARRHGKIARVVVQRGWGLPQSVPAAWDAWDAMTSNGYPMTRDAFVQRVDEWEHDAIAAVDATMLSDWLPSRRERVQGALVAVAPRCGDVNVPPPTLTGDGATEIFAFDMSTDDGAARDTVVLGGTSSIFASTDTLLLAQPDWSGVGGDTAATDHTALHVFAVSADSLATTYRASGSVPGVPLSQFAFDAQDDVIRVATTVTHGTIPSTVTSRVTTLRIDGGELTTLGATEDLAPGERLFAVRFLGTKAYLVTFRRIDPLFVIDMADPAHPQVLGQVDIAGFSEYLHALDDDHLITIGVDTDTHGAALRLFDVADPTAPRLTDMLSLPGSGWSPAEANHLVFTFDARLGLLAVPYTRFEDEFRSSLVLVAVDPGAGFTLRGEIDHESLGGDACPGEPFGPCRVLVDMERGIFIDDWIYSISSVAVRVNAIDDLSAVATVLLPSSQPTPVPLPLPLPEPTPS